MAEEEKLPLHDEAQARAKWRGGETIIGKGEASELPASEVDHAVQRDEAAPEAPRVDLRPPD